MGTKRATIRQDKRYPGMFRVHWPDGTLSDMVNLSRAHDAADRFNESERVRLWRVRKRGNGPLIDQNSDGVSR
jgi:hypothetical protein